MTEKALLFYLTSHPIVGPKLAGQIYFHSAPVGAKMPWCIIQNSGGMPKPLTMQEWTEESETLAVYIDSEDQFFAREVGEDVVKAVHNYRGDMGDIKDSHWRCGTPRDLDNYQGSFRCMITVYVKHKYETNYPADGWL